LEKDDYLLIERREFAVERRVIEHGTGINGMETF